MIINDLVGEQYYLLQPEKQQIVGYLFHCHFFEELNCYYCGERGHFSRNCPEIRCWECGKKGHEKKACFIKFFRMFANWNKRMNEYTARWKEYIQKIIINNKNKTEKKINSEEKKDEEIKKNENVELKNKNENKTNQKESKRQGKIEKNEEDVEKDTNKPNNNKIEDVVKKEENKKKFENDNIKLLINKNRYLGPINIDNKININLKSNKSKIKNNTKNKNGRKNNKIIRSKIRLLKKKY